MRKFEDQMEMIAGAKGQVAGGGRRSSNLTHIEGKLRISKLDKLNQRTS